MSVFDFDAHATPLDTAKAEAIEERFLIAVERHDRQDNDAFRRWFFGDLANLVHAISKRKGGVRLTRPEVRSGLLDLTYRSFRYLGDCVALQMQDFAAALPEPLNAAEKARFDALYTPQKNWGGLPFVLLRDRLVFIREAAFDLWDSPDDPRPAGVVLRLLDWYGQMVRRRREGDRQKKQRGGVFVGQLSSDDLEDNGVDEESQGNSNFFERIAISLLRQAGVRCACSNENKWFVRLGQGGEDADPIPLSYGCQHYCAVGELPVPRSTFAAAALRERESE